VPPLLPRFKRQQEVEERRKLEWIALGVEEVEDVAGMALRRSADGHNRDLRRGLPLITRDRRHVAWNGSVAALLAKRARSARRR
jgi:hypothetical protein